MKVLAIETSCDETAVAVIEGAGNFPAISLHTKSEVLLSQASLHAGYGGVFPAVAKREHAAIIASLIEDALKIAGLFVEGHTETASHTESFTNLFAHEEGLAEQMLALVSRIEKPKLDAIAVTAGPGLEPALWVGINAAKALGSIWNIPVIPTNHMEGHLFAPMIQDETLAETSLPLLGLLISGGHTEFVLMDKWFSYRVIGKTLDDAVGEAYDKTARLLGLPYPGGPAISKLAERAREEGLVSPWRLPRPMLQSDTLDFSFSGLKTAVLYTVQKIEVMTDELRMLLALEFENAVAETLISKTRKALLQTNAKTVLLGGGVSANTHIRRELGKLVAEEFSDVTLLLPDPKITGDNAVMIGQAAAARILSGDLPKGGDIRAEGNLSL